MRGERRKVELQMGEDVSLTGGSGDIIDIADYEPRNRPSPTWRECIKKVWEVDPLICPQCQGEMKIVGFITDYLVVRKILKHLDLWDRSPPPEPDKSPAGEEVICEPYDDGWPGYEVPFVVVQ